MILNLKNGENIRLEWNYLVIEYLEEREGSLEELQEKINKNDQIEKVRLSNSFVYAIVQANVDDVLTYKQAIRLIKLEDYPKIFNFLKQQLEIQKSYKKKGTSKKSGNQHRSAKKKQTGPNSNITHSKLD